MLFKKHYFLYVRSLYFTFYFFLYLISEEIKQWTQLGGNMLRYSKLRIQKPAHPPCDSAFHFCIQVKVGHLTLKGTRYGSDTDTGFKTLTYLLLGESYQVRHVGG